MSQHAGARQGGCRIQQPGAGTAKSCASVPSTGRAGMHLGLQCRMCSSAASPAQGGSLLRWRPAGGLSHCLPACRTQVMVACSRPPQLWRQPQQLQACWQVGPCVTVAHPASPVAPCLTSVWPAKVAQGENGWTLQHPLLGMAKPLRDMFLGCQCSTPQWGERGGQHHQLGGVPALCALSGDQSSPQHPQLRPDVPGLQRSSELVMSSCSERLQAGCQAAASHLAVMHPP